MLSRLLRLVVLVPLVACGIEGKEEADGGEAGTGGSSGEGVTSEGTTNETGGEVLPGRLIGLSLAPGMGWQTVELDLTSGELIHLGSLPAEFDGIVQGVGTYDPATDRIYQLSGGSQLLVIDGGTGAFVKAAPLVLGALNGVINLEVRQDGAVVALADAPGEGAWDVVTVDPDTGVVASLAALPPQPGIQQGTSTLDLATDRMYQVNGDGELLVIDAGSGALVDSVSLVLGELTGVTALEISAAGALVGLGSGDGPGVWDVVEVDPSTGVVTKRTSLSPQPGIVQGMSTFDRATDREVVLGGEGRVLVIGGATGELLSTVTVMPGALVGFSDPEFVW